jgi:hypothetical protein
VVEITEVDEAEKRPRFPWRPWKRTIPQQARKKYKLQTTRYQVISPWDWERYTDSYI